MNDKLSLATADDYWHNAYAYDLMAAKYEDIKAISKEVRNKKKSLEEINPDNPFYHRAAVSAEMAQMREDIALIVNENKRMHQMIETIGDLHQRLSVVYGAYDHVKMLADKSRIDYALIAKGIQTIIELKEELTNEITRSRTRTDGQES